eukprot:m.223694 g.223694  ORF g.223694 m.223694 type:complete len:360 (+) comp22325_c2_seq15:58-1137(+)
MKKNREEGHLRQVHSWNMLGPRSVIFVTVVHACLVWSTSACAAAASTVPVGEIALDSEGHLVLTDSHNTTTLGYVLEQLKQLNSVVAAQSSLIQQQQQLLQPHDCSAVRGLDFPNHITLNAAGTAAVYCDMEHDGGGWTLVSVSSDDGQDTWTWANRFYFSTNTATFGSLNNLNRDFKSPALHEVLFRDILFVHAPSGVWASYHNVSDNTMSLGRFIGNTGMQCYYNRAGFPMTAGTLQAANTLLCGSTDLYFNALDADGGFYGAGVCSPNQQETFGPCWNAREASGGRFNNGCPWDDPGNSASLGPTRPGSSAGPGEYGLPDLSGDGFTTPAVGFGQAVGLNTGTPGSGQNNMRVFVR